MRCFCNNYIANKLLNFYLQVLNKLNSKLHERCLYEKAKKFAPSSRESEVIPALKVTFLQSIWHCFFLLLCIQWKDKTYYPPRRTQDFNTGGLRRGGYFGGWRIFWPMGADFVIDGGAGGNGNETVIV